ncbi:MAG: proteasome assembly chaperone family protein [Conexivisphaera sp.]
MIEVLPRGRSFDGKTLVAGFYGIGATGYYAVRYMAEALGAQRVAYVSSDLTAPISTSRRGRVVTPAELHEAGDLVFLRVEFPVQRENEFSFYRELAAWVASAGLREVALVGGLDSTLRRDETDYRVVFTSAFEPRGILSASKALEDELIIVGPVAVLLNELEARGFPAYAVLAYASTERVDPRAAANAVRVLSEIYGVSVNTEPLLTYAEKIESQVKLEMQSVKPRGESIYT